MLFYYIQVVLKYGADVNQSTDRAGDKQIGENHLEPGFRSPLWPKSWEEKELIRKKNSNLITCIKNMSRDHFGTCSNVFKVPNQSHPWFTVHAQGASKLYRQGIIIHSIGIGDLISALFWKGNLILSVYFIFIMFRTQLNREKILVQQCSLNGFQICLQIGLHPNPTLNENRIRFKENLKSDLALDSPLISGLS